MADFINAIANPNFETDLGHWSSSSLTFSRDTGTSYAGAASMKVVSLSSSNDVASDAQTVPAVLGQAGATVRLTAAMKGAVGGEVVQLVLCNAAFTTIGATSPTFTLTTAWKVYEAVVSISIASTSFALLIFNTSAAATWWVDQAGIMSPVGPYFDGSTLNTPAFTYAWTGTANESISTATATTGTGWPLVDDAVSFMTGPNSAMPAPYWCSLLERTEGAMTTTRGRQYELDQVAAGQSALTVQNTDGAFDASNTGSPFYPNVTPYRAHRRRAQYPATVNLLTADQATAGVVQGLTIGGSVLPQWATASGTITIANTLAANTYHFASGTGPTLSITGWSVVPNGAFTGQAQMKGASAGDTVSIYFQWFDATGTLISSSTAATFNITTSTQTIQATAVAPVNAAGAALVISSQAGASAVDVWHVQVEHGYEASTYVQPNTWYNLVTDYVERWPQRWHDNGNYGTCDLQCVDAFGYLSQRQLLSPAYMEVMALSPTWLYPLDEATGAQRFVDLTNNQPNAVPVTSPLGAVPLVAAGGQLQNTRTLSAGYVPQGISGPVVTFTNDGTTYHPAAFSYIQLPSWTQAGGLSVIIAFRVANLPTYTGGATTIWQGGVPGGGGNTISVDYQGTISFTGSSPANLGPVVAGDWHLAGFSTTGTGACFLDGTSNTAFIPNNPAGTATGTIAAIPASIGAVNGNDMGFNGDIAFAACLPVGITSAQWNTIYSAFRYAGSGLGTASSGTRYQDILRWAQWAGLQAEDTATTGETNSYGPSTELKAAASQSGTDCVSALMTVVSTDNGFHYVAADGTVTFESRGDRYNQTSPAVIFGENTGGGEIPYTDAQFTLDPTRLANDAAITQTSTSITTRIIDHPSVGVYGDVQLSRNVNTLDPLEIMDAATFLVDRYRTPMTRCEGVTVDVGAYPSAWGPLLGLELGAYVRIMRRPPNAPAITFNGFVEQINWTWDDQLNASCALQVSPQGSLQFWQLDSATFSVLGSTTICGY